MNGTVKRETIDKIVKSIKEEHKDIAPEMYETAKYYIDLGWNRAISMALTRIMEALEHEQYIDGSITTNNTNISRESPV